MSKKVKRKTKSKKRVRRKNKKKIVIIILFLILLVAIIALGLIYLHKEKETQVSRENLKKEIASHYSEFVITTKETNLYKLAEGKYLEFGKIGKNQELTLEETNITYQDEYLKVKTFEEEYYIYYQDIEKITELSVTSDRYKKYLPFNQSIITNDTTNFYDKNDNLIYSFNKSFDLAVIIKTENTYGVEYNNQLLYIKKDDVKELKDKQNTSETNTKGIAVFNYHFFYDETKASERQDCNQIICHSKSLFESHLKYIKENNIFTPTMEEFEMYLDKQINLPKSVLITIDDGWRMQIGTDTLEAYQLNGTVFLITSWFEKIDFLYGYKYVEFHSHGDDLHDQGVCSGGQGGAIKCLNKTKLLADLALSREKLDGSTAFCYPFYEYNSYSIEVLKEAGFTMAFRGGFQKAIPGVNKYEIPRYVIYNNTTVSQIASYIN